MKFYEALKAMDEGEKVIKDNKIIMYKNTNNDIITIHIRSDGSAYSTDILPYFDCKSLFDYGWEIYEGSLLTDKEMEYLRAVIHPYRHRLNYITKELDYSGKYEHIRISIDGFSIDLPWFKKNTMYECLEMDKEYTNEELGLFTDEELEEENKEESKEN